MNEIEPHLLGQRICLSDMRLSLENLERMFHACRYCLNNHAANAVLFGMAIEAQTLALKMKAMLGRWNKYLPFHEVIDVKFDYWQALVSEWIEVLAGNPTEETAAKYPWIDGCKEYMLDLYALTEQTDEEGKRVTRAPKFYEVDIKDDYQREMTAYMECMDELLDEMEDEDEWRMGVADMTTFSLRDACQSADCPGKLAEPVVRPGSPVQQGSAQRDVYPLEYPFVLSALPGQLSQRRSQRKQVEKQLAGNEAEEECREEKGRAEKRVDRQALWTGIAGIHHDRCSGLVQRIQLWPLSVQEPSGTEGGRLAGHPQGVS